MAAFEWGSWRQDDVCVPGCFVDIWIDRNHELETLERAIQFTSVWRRQHRIARERHERFHLSFTRRENLFRERDDRKFSGKLRQLPHAAVPARVTAARSNRIWRAEGIKRR